MISTGNVDLRLNTFTNQLALSLPFFSPVPVSIPVISVVGHAILGRPVKVLCQSHTGSLPITYTLIKDYDTVSTTTVSQTTEQAIFTVSSASDLKSYMCEAKNSKKNPKLSRRLNASVTGKYFSLAFSRYDTLQCIIIKHILYIVKNQINEKYFYGKLFSLKMTI